MGLYILYFMPAFALVTLNICLIYELMATLCVFFTTRCDEC